MVFEVRGEVFEHFDGFGGFGGGPAGEGFGEVAFFGFGGGGEGGGAGDGAPGVVEVAPLFAVCAEVDELCADLFGVFWGHRFEEFGEGETAGDGVGVAEGLECEGFEAGGGGFAAEEVGDEAFG